MMLFFIFQFIILILRLVLIMLAIRLRYFHSNLRHLVKSRSVRAGFKVNFTELEPWKLLWKLRDTVTRCCTRKFVP